MILSNTQTATLQRILAACNNVLPRIEMLEALGAINPAIGNRVRELRTQREYQVQLANTTLEVDRQLSARKE